MGAINFGDERLPPRFWDKVQPCPMSGCWLWFGSWDRLGYGQAHVPGTGALKRAHRMAYEILVGSLGVDLDLDHLCRVRCCVNPAHLEPVTQRENFLRGRAPAAINATKTSCSKGHPFTEENTYRPPSGGRICRICCREKNRTWNRKHKARRAA